MIEWEDSGQPIPGWAHLSDFQPPSVIKCASVGWLIHDGPEVKVLAPNMGGLENENNVQVSGIIRIPARCIIRISALEEPEITSSSVLSSHPATTPKQQVF